MSLLEDVFLEDEANEAQELERVIEGEEFDERPRWRSDSNENSEREDEAEEEKKRVDPTSTKTRRVTKNPRFILNPARLTGPRGIQVIPEHFKDFKFKGKGHEKEDLDLVLKKLEHWAYRLYPKFQFEDCLKKIETLGKKRPVMVHLHKIRSDQFISEETVVQKDSSEDEAPPEDEFDKLLQQQIELARSTPAPGSVKKGVDSAAKENRLMMPKVTSSPSISDEQRERILKMRKLAEERRLAKLNKASNTTKTFQNLESISNTSSKTDDTAYIRNKIDSIINGISSANADNNGNLANSPNKSNVISYSHERVNIENIEENVGNIRKSRTNVIDSSDEDDTVLMNESVKAVVHSRKNEENEVNGVKEGSENTDHKIDDRESDSSSDEDNIVIMNESFKADVHSVESEKHQTSPKNDGFKHRNDRIILETDANSQEMDQLVTDEGTVFTNKDKSHAHELDRIEVDELTRSNCDIYLEKAKTNEENDSPEIITESNTENNHEISSNHNLDKVCDSREVEHNSEVEKHQEAILNESEDRIIEISEKNVESNVDDELMDVEFDDDF